MLLYCTLLYCAVLYSTILHCAVQYCTLERCREMMASAIRGQSSCHRIRKQLPGLSEDSPPRKALSARSSASSCGYRCSVDHLLLCTAPGPQEEHLRRRTEGRQGEGSTWRQCCAVVLHCALCTALLYVFQIAVLLLQYSYLQYSLLQYSYCSTSALWTTDCSTAIAVLLLQYSLLQYSLLQYSLLQTLIAVLLLQYVIAVLLAETWGAEPAGSSTSPRNSLRCDGGWIDVKSPE